MNCKTDIYGLGHMALVSDDPGGESGALGVITLEDVIEELIGEEIIDETDVYVDGKNKIAGLFESFLKIEVLYSS